MVLNSGKRLRMLSPRSKSFWNRMMCLRTMGRERTLGAITLPAFALALVLIAAAALWLWYGVSQRSLDLDDGITLLAAQGILDHGYQVLPSGFLYHRAYLPHYLVAASIGVFGVNDLSLMIPSLLLSLGSVYIVYLIARNIFGKPWIGVLTALLMVLAGPQLTYATSPRMYMSLQFFTLLATYTAWRGFVDGERNLLLRIGTDDHHAEVAHGDTMAPPTLHRKYKGATGAPFTSQLSKCAVTLTSTPPIVSMV